MQQLKLRSSWLELLLVLEKQYKFYEKINNVEKKQANNPLHGITLEKMLSQLIEHYDWTKLGKIINIRCFTHEPSIKSSLKFLRKTPWARSKVEDLYLQYVKENLD